MTMPLIMAHDIGTSATKTSIVSHAGEVVDTHSYPHPTRNIKPGWSEQAPDDWWNGVCVNTHALLDRHSDMAPSIAGIGVSGHMLGAILIDRDGQPLRPALLHSDTRGTVELENARHAVGEKTVYDTTGNILDGRSPLCKCLWIQHHEPDVWKRVHRLIQSKDYIVGRLTGTFDTTDYSDASHAQLLDIQNLDYAYEMLETIGINREILPQAKASTEIAGHLSAESARALGLPSGIPVSVGGGDGSCASVGAGAVLPGNTYCCFGTTAWISMTAEKAAIDPQQRLFNIVSLDGKSCGVFGTVQCAGRSIDWMRQVLEEDDFVKHEKQVLKIPAGSEGLIFLPYLEGERAPIYDAKARGVFFGLTPSHKRSHLLRATVEGVCLGLRSVIQILRETQPIESFRIIGGGARSHALRSILASACNASVKTLSVAAADATALGAALAAGSAVGIFNNLQEAASSIRETDITEPITQDSDMYDAIADRQIEIYQCLKPLFEKYEE